MPKVLLPKVHHGPSLAARTAEISSFNCAVLSALKNRVTVLLASIIEVLSYMYIEDILPSRLDRLI